MPAYKYTLKDGKTVRWYAAFYYTDWTGQRKHASKRGFKTQREAKEYERSVLDQGKKSGDILFSSLVENYLEDMSHRLKPTTMETKRWFIENKILPYFGSRKISDINALDIRKWQNKMLHEKTDDGIPYSPTYLKTMHRQFSAVMNYAVRYYNLSENPCATAGSIGKSKANKMKIWTQAQYELFISNVANPCYRVAYDILFYTGMRCGELLALTPVDILPDMQISISKNFAIVKGQPLILEPKTPNSVRTVSIPEFLYNEIQEFYSASYIQLNNRLFEVPRITLAAYLKRAAKRVGLDPIRIHDLRHSHVSMLINMGVQPKEISERIGHSSIKTTMDVYGHLYPDAARNLADTLNQLRSSPDSGLSKNVK